MQQDYEHKAVRTKIQGHSLLPTFDSSQDVQEYDSKLEARMALLLIKHRIPFTRKRRFKCIGPRGKEFTYTPDFVFEEPQKLQGCSQHVMALEVKGVLKPHDWVRIEALKYCHELRCFLVLETLITYWESYGINSIHVKDEV